MPFLEMKKISSFMLLSVKNKSGFTLLETLFAVSISMLLFFIITYLYTVNQNVYKTADKKNEITQNARVVIDRISREIRQTQDMVSDLPPDASNPAELPQEIIFQDGHNNIDNNNPATSIQYIRYYLDGHNLMRQTIAYYFSDEPGTYTHWYAKDKTGQSPLMTSTTPRIVGEYIDDISFWGDKLININITLSKENQTQTIFTSVYGRNL